MIGGGLLGGTVAHELGRGGHDVVAFSRSRGPLLDDVPGNVRVVSGTIGRSPELGALIDAAEVVFYFAGGSTPAGAAADAGGSVSLSVVPATAVLELMRASSTRRLVIASSGGTVYGEPAGYPTDEADPTDPIGIHGYNALTVERYVDFFVRRWGIEAVVLRVATAYGPGQRTRRGQGVIAAWIAAAQAGVPLPVYGPPTTQRDCVYSEDVARAAVRAGLLAPAGVYNVGSGTSAALTDVLAVLSELAGGELRVSHHPARGVDVAHTELDCKKLAAATGWRPKTSLADGLQATWKWSLTHASTSD